MKSNRTDMRHHILEAGKPIILSKGFSAVGLSEILTAAEVPKGSFYYYFKSKEAFGEALLEAYFVDYLDRLEESLGHKDLSGAERLMRLWGRWIETQTCDGVDGKCMAVKLGAEVADLSEPMRTVLEHGTDRIVERVTRCIQEGLADKSLHDLPDPAQTALALYELWLGATLLGKLRRDSSAFDGAMAATRSLLKLS